MNILVLGGDGMLGHQFLLTMAERHDVTVTLHRPLAVYSHFGIFTDANSIASVEMTDDDQLRAVIDRVRPEAVINCTAVKRLSGPRAAISSIQVNSILPHRLLELCDEYHARLVHLSTDCVFSGRTGNYRESDSPDPVDLYGRSKLLGEVSEAPGLTLRTSIVGLELRRFTGLIEWFLAQTGVVRGFPNVIYTGFTTRELVRVLEFVLVDHPRLHGLWHVASMPISKYDLLVSLAGHLGRKDVEVVPDERFALNRSLSQAAFETETGYNAPSWERMLTELAEEIRSQRPDRRTARPE